VRRWPSSSVTERDITASPTDSSCAAFVNLPVSAPTTKAFIFLMVSTLGVRLQRGFVSAMKECNLVGGGSGAGRQFVLALAATAKRPDERNVDRHPARRDVDLPQSCVKLDVLRLDGVVQMRVHRGRYAELFCLGIIVPSRVREHRGVRAPNPAWRRACGPCTVRWASAAPPSLLPQLDRPGLACSGRPYFAKASLKGAKYSTPFLTARAILT
jgi:hypothetical protein